MQNPSQWRLYDTNKSVLAQKAIGSVKKWMRNVMIFIFFMFPASSKRPQLQTTTAQNWLQHKRTVQYLHHKTASGSKSYQIRLWILALLAEDKLADESVEQVLEAHRLVRPVDDVAVVLDVKLGLSAELTTKVLRRVCDDGQAARPISGCSWQCTPKATVDGQYRKGFEKS